ncbi:glycosyltransferase family 1 protein [Anaerocolumna sp. MB42-C2]|uniref:glycosyltransferase family 1 protein n=1 Tax=Anaerocolumna sp. MB42-C2 TaxID=3070997 RepID=UPI0027DEE61F|nr:glycosyltransferase family 1 protein [Anaerocolumna sp. MB42-C2]WMJ86134.1 glycosyltransferase family 1 protein [Anaerocolumna sp. MB42-C2]
MINKWKSILKIKVKGISHSLQATVEKRQVNSRLDNYDPGAISNNKPSKINKITFVIERMAKYSGGQTSILRLGTELSKLGYQVGYIVYKPQTKSDMIECSSSNLSNYEGEMYTNKYLDKLNSDIVIASSWDTVAFAKKMKGYKMYFIQDYEPYFYSFGELFLMAKKTYEQGLHMVSLGPWNKEMVEKNCKIISPVDEIEFPYESREYPTCNRDYAAYAKKKEFTLAVYLKYYGKRLPCITQYLLRQVKEEFKRDGITLNIKYFGEDKSFRCDAGENLGMLSKKELLSLYKRSDFGMVASMSNISLVPYEMLATGLPLIEFEDGTFPYFFPDNSAILTSLSYKDLYLKMKEVIKKPQILEEMHNTSGDYLKSLSWQKSAKEFSDILNGLL